MPPIHNYQCECGTRLENQFRHLSDPPIHCPDCELEMEKEFTSQISIAIPEPHRDSKSRFSVHSQHKTK